MILVEDRYCRRNRKGGLKQGIIHTKKKDQGKEAHSAVTVAQ